MKKNITYILVLTLTVFLSCSKDTDTHDLIDYYFAGNELNTDLDTETWKLTIYSYFDKATKKLVYLDDFNNPNTGTWNAFDNEFGKSYYDDGKYKIKALKDHYYVKDIPYDQNKDFQIEFKFRNHIYNYGATTRICGFVFNIGQDNNGYRCFFSNENPYFSVIDADNPQDAGFKASLKYIRPNLFTIRKINDKISFFIDKEWVVTRNFQPHLQPSGIAYLISKGSRMEIDKVVIEYL